MNVNGTEIPFRKVITFAVCTLTYSRIHNWHFGTVAISMYSLSTNLRTLNTRLSHHPLNQKKKMKNYLLLYNAMDLK